jgi:hypothetical protein
MVTVPSSATPPPVTESLPLPQPASSARDARAETAAVALTPTRGPNNVRALSMTSSLRRL